MLRFTDMEAAGYIPGFLDENDPRPAIEQIDTAYISGWNDFNGFTLVGGGDKPYSLRYPGDPSMCELSRAVLRDEKLVLFQCSWFAIIQADGSYRVARLD